MWALLCLVFSLMAIVQVRRPLSRLTPTAPLKGAPRRCCALSLHQCKTFAAKRCPNRRVNLKPLPRSAAPSRGSGASAPKGSPEERLEQRVKENVGYKNLLSLRDRCAHRSWQSASPLCCTKRTTGSKRNGFPRRFAPRNDRLI